MFVDLAFLDSSYLANGSNPRSCKHGSGVRDALLFGSGASGSLSRSKTVRCRCGVTMLCQVKQVKVDALRVRVSCMRLAIIISTISGGK